jgi:TonB-linked SusC/RagA family outer membrane protein
MQEFATRKAIAPELVLRQPNCLFRKYRMAVRIMKLTTILVTVACLQLSAKGITQTVTISVKDAPLYSVLKAIQKQTDFTFIISNRQLQKAKPVSLTATNMPLRQVLELCFKDQPLTYKIIDKVISVMVKESKDDKTSFTPPLPQNIDVSGKVTDENGAPLAGANVVEKGKQHGTTTNADGIFVLGGVDGNGSLEISYVGFQTLTVSINSRTSIVISLKQGDGNLQEIVINKGYYSEYKKFNTGNVATVTSKEIEQQPVQNPLLALQGRVPGLVITQLTGQNRGAVQVRIQGQNSLNPNALNPLIIVDGIPYPSELYASNSGIENLLQGGSPLNYINPNDIESIDILKDADATAIYGSRAANGAILITTKKGKVGKAKLSVNLQQGWGRVTRHVDMMNTRQYLDMRYKAYENDGIDITTLTPDGTNYDLTLWDTTSKTDWQKTLIGGTAKYTNVNASISGGSSTMQYMIGGTYNRQTTVYPGNFDDRSGGVHFNVNGASPSQRLNITLSGSYVYDNNHLPGVDLTNTALTMEPNAPALFNDNGTLNWGLNASGRSTWTNPLAYIVSSDFKHTTKNLISNANIRYNIFRGLDFVSNFGYTNLQNDLYTPVRLEFNPPERRATSVRRSTFTHRNTATWIIEPQLHYSFQIGKGKIETLAGSTFQKNNAYVLQVSASGFSNDQLMQSAIAAPTKTVSIASSTLYNYAALFGRLNFNWDGKYIINLTGRRDGSSRFGDANKFHNFGSAGVAWLFSEEKWMQRVHSFVSFGKLRGSFGTTGNDQIGDYKYISTYTAFTDPIPYQNLSYLRAISLPNPHLQWEETKKWQAGVDLGFLKDRIILGATYVLNQSSNQLTGYTLPAITGFSSITENFPATIRNTSWEFTLNTVNIKRRDLSWSTNLNLTLPKNKLIKFPNIEKSSYSAGTDGVVVGQPLGIIATYPYGGVDPATGYYTLIDTTGKPTPTPTGDDIKQNVLVSTLPKFYGGMENTISYKGFQLSFFFQFVYQKGPRDFYYWNGQNNPGAFEAGHSNQPTTVTEHWKKPGDNVPIGKLTTDNSFPMFPIYTGDWYSYDASYVRLKNVTLSWQLPKPWLRSNIMQSCLIYFRGQNLMTITKYKGLDPETGNVTLPPLQMWTIGVKLEL